MPVPKIGYRAVYGSNRALDADHSAYMTHGGLIVRCTKSEAPDPNTDMLLRIVAPEGAAFDLEARAGHYLPKKGFMVSFEESVEARAALDGFVASEAFRGAVAREGQTAVAPPEFVRFDPATAPPVDAAPFDDVTPLDDALPPLDEPTALHPDLDTIPKRRPSPPSGLHPDVDAVAARRPRARPAAKPSAAPTGATGKTTIRKPASGAEYAVYVVKYTQVTAFAAVVEAFEKSAMFPVPIADETAAVDDVALLRLTLPGRNVYELQGVVEAVEPETVWIRVDENDELFRKACLYPTTIAARNRLESERATDKEKPTVLRITDTAPDEEFERMPIRRRLARMGMDEKINMALAGNREERMALAMDGNRAVHHYLLKNAKITLDEIAFMARLPGLNPDVLEKIAENPMYTQNPTVTKALVYNPKTPIRTAIRLLDRMPRPEVMNLAKRSNMNLRLVMAAKKKIERFKG